MKIRTNRFAKLFITLVFVFEFFFPALPIEADEMTCDYYETCHIKTYTNPSSLLVLFNEQRNENEGENNKTELPPVEFMLHLTFTNRSHFENSRMVQFTNSSLLFNCHPALFLLHHSYLI